MRKKTKKILIIATFLVILLAIITILVMNSPKIAQASYGSVIMSIDSVEVIDSGTKLVIEGRISGASAENLQIDLNQDDINDLLRQKGYKINDIATLSMTMDNPSREFIASRKEYENFLKLGYFDKKFLKTCDESRPSGVVAPSTLIGLTNLCGYEYSAGLNAPWTGVPVDDTEVTFKLDNTVIGTLNPSTGKNVIRNGNNKIEWAGNLLNYQGLESSPSYNLLWYESKYNRLIDSNAYDTYMDERVWFGITGLSKWTISSQKARDKLDQFNSRVDEILTNRESEYLSDINAKSVEYTEDGLKVYLNTATVFPSFKITLDAKFVAIEELSGKPSITSCTADKTIKSGEKYNTQTTVKNIGQNDGTFFGKIECSGESNIATVGIPGQLVKKDSTVIITQQLSAINSNQGTQANKCTITIADAESGESASCVFNLNVEYQDEIICIPNKVECATLKQMKTCSADGQTYTLTDCPYGCVTLVDGTAQCRLSTCTTDKDCKSGEICKDGYCVEDDSKCKPWVAIGRITIIPNIWCLMNLWLMKFRIVFAIILGFLGGLLSGLYAKKLIDKQKLSSKLWILLVVGVIVGLALGFLAYWYFWTIVIVLIVLGIIKAFIPGI